MSRNNFRNNNSKYSSGVGTGTGTGTGKKVSKDSGFGSEVLEKSTVKATPTSLNPFAEYSTEQLMRIINTNEKKLEPLIMKSQNVIEAKLTNDATIRYHV